MSIKAKLGLDKAARIGTTSSSPYTGSPTFDEIPFHVDEGRRPALYTYVVVETDSNEKAIYGRIVNGTEENPRADPQRLQQNRAYQVGQKDPRPSDLSPHVTRIMQIEVLGELRLNEDEDIVIREPGTLAQTGKSVYELPIDRLPQLLGIPNSPDSGLFLGVIESGDHRVDFFLPLDALPRHIVIVGKTGVGKSYATGVIAEEINRHGIPIFTFDVLGDMVNATEDLGGRNFRAIDDFRVPYSIIGVGEFLGFIPNLTRDQSEIVTLAYDEIFSEAIRELEDNGTVDTPLERLLDRIHSIADDFGQGPVGERAARRVGIAVRRNPLLTTRTENWLTELIEKPIVNVFIGHLGERSRNLVIGAVSRILQVLRRKGLIPPFVFIVDEAHLFLPAGHEVTSSTYVLREMVRTARHDAIGIILITQSPSSMDKQIFLTCNTRIVFALDKDDLILVSGTLSDAPEEVLKRIPKLAKATAIISSGMDIMRHSVLVKIRRRERTREGAPTPNMAAEVKRWRNLA